METVWRLLVVVHLIGMAAVVGGWLTQVRVPTPRVPAAVVWGAAIQIISGPVMVGLASADVVHHSVNNPKIGVKLVIALAVFVIAHLGRHREKEATEAAGVTALPAAAGAGGAAVATVTGTSVWTRPIHLAGALALVNVLIAVLWH